MVEVEIITGRERPVVAEEIGDFLNAGYGLEKFEVVLLGSYIYYIALMVKGQ